MRSDRDLPGSNAPQIGAPAGQRLVISLESLDRRTGIVVHELTHQFAFDIVPGTSRVAPVLIEGLAEHQRGAWTAEDLRRTRDAVAAGAIPSMATLAETDHHWAHAVFDFVAVQHGSEGVRRLLFALRAHETLVQAVPMAFGITQRSVRSGAPRLRDGQVRPALTVALHLDLNAKLHDPLRRQAEERRGANRVARHQDEQLLAPHRHPSPVASR